MSNWKFFMDETGDHGLSFVDPNFPVFVLTGVLIGEEEYDTFCTNINSLKKKYFGTTGAILHSRDIRKIQGIFQILFDLEVKKRFYADINQIIGKTNYKIIASAIHKEKHVKLYGKAAKNPYEIALNFIIERLIFELDDINNNPTVDIMIEMRGKKEDQELLDHYNSIKDRGTYYVESDRLKTVIRRFDFVSKFDNINGLQLADLCAYPIARHVIAPKILNESYEIIKTKIRSSRSGKVENYGIKIFPN